MKEEDHFTQTLLPALSHCCTWQQGCYPWQPLFLSCSLHILHSLLKICCSLLVPIYRQEWCLQLQLFFNNGGCQSQWLMPSICCTLMATNPTITPFAIHVGQLSACFFSTSLHLAALPSLSFWERLWPSLQVLATPFNHQSHQSTPFLTQKDHYNQMVCHFTSKEC
jgi:hypothetical protein